MRADVSTGRPQGSPVIDIVIGAAMVRILPVSCCGLDDGAARPREWRRDRGSGGNPIQQEAFNYGLFSVEQDHSGS